MTQVSHGQVVGRATRRTAIALALLGTCGCAHYQPQPVAPDVSLERFEARRLDDPALAQFLARRAGIGSWPPARWDLRSLTLAALYYSPELTLARARWDVAEAGVVTAGGRPDPDATAALGYNANAAPGVRPWIPEGVLDLTIETAGKRGLRLVEARQRADAARLDVLSAAWQVRADVRRALLGAFVSETGAELAETALKLRSRAADIIEQQHAVGEVSTAEVTTARIARDQARLDASGTEQQRARARAALASAVGVPAGALADVTLSFDDLQHVDVELPSPELRRRAAVSRPDILAALSRYEASQAALRLEIARQYPDIHLGPGYQLDQTDGKWTLGLGITLPIFNRNKGPIAEAEARRREAAAQFLAVQARAVTEVDAAIAACRAALKQADATRSLLAELEQRETSARAAYGLGEISRLQLLGLQTELNAARRARLDALAAAQQSVGDLEDALASPIPGEDWVVAGPQANGKRDENPR